ncbi:MAG: hypothetical protein LBU32_15935 [Clostridiales bacterium]|nr:hypothetical protein [Clostridiales bacterium]
MDLLDFEQVYSIDCLNRGLKLCRQGLVESIDFQNSWTADVLGFSVSLNLDEDFIISDLSCTCPLKDNECDHKAAVLRSLCIMLEEDQEDLEIWDLLEELNGSGIKDLLNQLRHDHPEEYDRFIGNYNDGFCEGEALDDLAGEPDTSSMDLICCLCDNDAEISAKIKIRYGHPRYALSSVKTYIRAFVEKREKKGVVEAEDSELALIGVSLTLELAESLNLTDFGKVYFLLAAAEELDSLSAKFIDQSEIKRAALSILEHAKAATKKSLSSNSVPTLSCILAKNSIFSLLPDARLDFLNKLSKMNLGSTARMALIECLRELSEVTVQ